MTRPPVKPFATTGVIGVSYTLRRQDNRRSDSDGLNLSAKLRWISQRITMECRTPQESKPIVAHSELAIVLGASRFDPAHINPDFLRYNEIVDAAWQVNPPVIIESGFSLVKYDNGLALTATNDDLRVSQIIQDSGVEETVVPEVLNRYLNTSPWPVEYQHIHTDLVGSMRIDGDGLELRLSPFSELSSQVQFNDVTPIIQVRAAFLLSDKSITIYVSEIRNADEVTALRFSAHIHRDIDNVVSSGERDEFVKSTLEKWNDDIRDFDELACQFYLSYVQKED